MLRQIAAKHGAPLRCVRRHREAPEDFGEFAARLHAGQRGGESFRVEIEVAEIFAGDAADKAVAIFQKIRAGRFIQRSVGLVIDERGPKPLGIGVEPALDLLRVGAGGGFVGGGIERLQRAGAVEGWDDARIGEDREVGRARVFFSKAAAVSWSRIV